MVEQYIEDKQYKSALELLTDLNDENTRYLRLVCLYGLNELEQASIEAKMAKGLATDTYYEVVSMYVVILKDLQAYDEAIDILVEELSMPYIPEPYGGLLNNAYDDILIEKQENVDLRFQKQTIFSEDEFRLILTKETHQEVIMSALEQLQNYNIRRVLPEVRFYLKDPNKDSLIKSLLIEIMIDQEIDEELEVFKNDQYYDINPIYQPNVLDNQNYEEITRLLIQNLEDDNPSLLELCIQYLEFFLYDYYPREIYEDDAGLIAASIHYYMATLQSIPFDIEDAAYIYGVQKDEILTNILSLRQLEG